MNILAISLSSPSSILWALLPLVLVMLLVKWLDERADLPALPSLEPAQKAWLALMALEPPLAAQVLAQWGPESSARYLQEASKLPNPCAALKNKALEEFCKLIYQRHPDYHWRGETSMPQEFIIFNYLEGERQLPLDLASIWPVAESAAPSDSQPASQTASEAPAAVEEAKSSPGSAAPEEATLPEGSAIPEGSESSEKIAASESETWAEPSASEVEATKESTEATEVTSAEVGAGATLTTKRGEVEEKG